MAIFAHPFRSVLKAILALVAGHIIMKLLPHSIQVIHLTQTSVTVLVIAALVYFIVKHHNNEGQRMTDTQAELTIIVAFGVFWFAFLLAMRAFNQSGVEVDLMHPRSAFSPSTGNAESNVVGGRGSSGYSPPPSRYGDRPRTGYRKEYPCDPRDAYCVVEEWAFY